MDKQYLKLKLQSYDENKKVSMILNKFRHDLKNHMLCMQIMLKNNQFEELDKYFLQLSNEISKVIIQFKTGNTVIDTVLSSKIALANFYKIPVDIEIPNLIEVEIKAFELCAILSNLLDNAIEASSKFKESKIKIKISSVFNCIIIIISNKINENILISNPKLITTKKDKLNHGVGLSIVNDIVKKYDGTISFYMDDGYFNVNIALPKRVTY
ncbi:sensor histidine kinase [Clostridium tertium]